MKMGVNNVNMGQYEMQRGINEFATGTQINNMANMGYGGNMGYNGNMGYGGRPFWFLSLWLENLNYVN